MEAGQEGEGQENAPEAKEEGDGFQPVRRRRQGQPSTLAVCLQTRGKGLDGESLFAGGSLEDIIAFYAKAGFLLQNDQGLWGYSPPWGTHVLHATIVNKRLDLLDFFLRAGASPLDVEEATGRWAHHEACVCGNLPALEMLLEYLTVGNADFLRQDPKDNNGLNSLLLASQALSLSIVTFLLGQGAKVNSKCTRGRNSLHIITGFKESEIKKSDKLLGIPLDICKMLIKKGIAIDRSDKAGITPLMLATQQGNQAIVRLLVTHGADVDRIAPNFHTATWKHNLSVREHIAKLGPQSTLSKAIDYGVNEKRALTKQQELELVVERALASLLPSRDIGALIIQFCQDDLGETLEEPPPVAPKKKKKKDKAVQMPPAPPLYAPSKYVSRRIGYQRIPTSLKIIPVLLGAYVLGGTILWLIMGGVS
jgi:ankyrin repeat protein